MTTADQRLNFDTAVICYPDVQHALLQIGLPVLDEKAVARHKRCARLAMLWRSIQWLVVALVVLVAFESLGKKSVRLGIVCAAAFALISLFIWLVNKYDLQWATLDYSTYRNLYGVPEHVSTAADALKRFGFSDTQIGVEYLKDDPILYVKENGRRYSLIMW